MQISLMLGNLRQPLEQALDTVQRLQIPAVQVSAHGPFAPATCGAPCRRQLREALRRRGLALSAISGCGRGLDLGNAGRAQEQLDAAFRALEMAADLMADQAVRIWQDHVGVLPNPPEGPRWDSFVRCAEAIARQGEKVGACLAVETGPEPAAVVEKWMRTVDSPALRVNYDPANLILYPSLFRNDPHLIEQFGHPAKPYEKQAAFEEFEPIEGVRRLGRYIVHTHAKDAWVDQGVAREVPLGEGWVDWPRYLALLEDVGFDGYLAIERETGENPAADIARAAEFLCRQLRRNRKSTPS